MLISCLVDHTYNNHHYKGSTSFNLGQLFSFDVKGGEKLGVWRIILGEKLGVILCLKVFIGGDQTPKWFPSSPKGDIVGIMAYVLSLMET